MTAVVAQPMSKPLGQTKELGLPRAFGLFAILAIVSLYAYMAAPRVRVVCYGSGTVTECARAADAVIARVGRSQSVDAAAVYTWRGCPPGAHCPLRLDSRIAPLSASVGVRFADGSPSVLRSVDRLGSWPMAVIEAGGNQPDRFVEMMLQTRGVQETWVRQVTGQ
jgi:hypothetical protein